jgi:hypothetical protein
MVQEKARVDVRPEHVAHETEETDLLVKSLAFVDAMFVASQRHDSAQRGQAFDDLAPGGLFAWGGEARDGFAQVGGEQLCLAHAERGSGVPDAGGRMVGLILESGFLERGGGCVDGHADYP